MTTASGFSGRFGVFFRFILKKFESFVYLLLLPKSFLLGRPLGHFLCCFFPRVSFPFFLGVGREVSKAQRVRRVRPQGALFMARLHACCVVFAVLFWAAGVRGIWLHVLSWGKLEVCQRPPDSIP